MRHFEKELNSQLPTGPPWECPFPNCKVEPKDNLHYLRLHYGIEHNVARKLYDQRLNPQAAPSDPAGEINDDSSPFAEPPGPAFPNLRLDQDFQSGVQRREESSTTTEAPPFHSPSPPQQFRAVKWRWTAEWFFLSPTHLPASSLQLRTSL